MVGSKSVGGVTTVAFAALLVPLVGIAFGFDGINSERSQGTLSRLLAQPVHRDDVVNGKFVAGIAVIALMLGALVAVTAGLGIIRLGIIPSPEELARVVAWLLSTILYASFWLAFALLLSVVIRGAASAALVGFGTWLGLILFGAFLLPLAANALFPPNTTGTANDYFASTTAQQVFLRISPATLYQDIVTALMNPATKTCPRRRQPRAVRQLPGAGAVAAVAGPVDPAGVAADRGTGRDDDRDVRRGIRAVPAPGGPRLRAGSSAGRARGAGSLGRDGTRARTGTATMPGPRSGARRTLIRGGRSHEQTER